MCETRRATLILPTIAIPNPAFPNDARLKHARPRTLNDRLASTLEVRRAANDDRRTVPSFKVAPGIKESAYRPTRHHLDGLEAATAQRSHVTDSGIAVGLATIHSNRSPSRRIVIGHQRYPELRGHALDVLRRHSGAESPGARHLRRRNGDQH
jgi:hypothetical protein